MDEQKTEQNTDISKHILIILLILSLIGCGLLYYSRTLDKTEINNLNQQLTDEKNKNTKLAGQIETQNIESTKKTVAPETTAADWKNYQNEKYGFKITFQDKWKGFTVKEETLQGDNGVHFRFYVPTTDKSFSPTNPGFADVFVLSVYKLADWDNMQGQEQLPTLLKKDSKYAYTYSRWQACPKDLCDVITDAELKNIISTFSL